MKSHNYEITNHLGPEWTSEQGIWTQGNDQGLIFDRGEGCRQRARSLKLDQAGYYDWNWYKLEIDLLIKELNDVPCIFDLACGDGRFLKYIVSNHPSASVVGIDSNISDLLIIKNDLDDEEKSRVTLINSRIENLSLPSKFADLVICTEVLYMMDNPQIGYNKISDVLKPDKGIAFVSNIARESYFIHALLNADFSQIARVVEEGCYIDSIRNDNQVFFNTRFLDENTRRSFEAIAGLECIKFENLSGYMSLILHCMRDNNAVNLSLLDRLAGCESVPQVPRLAVDWLKTAVESGEK